MGIRVVAKIGLAKVQLRKRRDYAQAHLVVSLVAGQGGRARPGDGFIKRSHNVRRTSDQGRTGINSSARDVTVGLGLNVMNGKLAAV